VIISIEALLLATYLVGSRTVMQMQSNAIGYAKFYSRSQMHSFVIISIEALLLATYLVGSRTVMQMQSNAIGYAKFYSRSQMQ